MGNWLQYKFQFQAGHVVYVPHFSLQNANLVSKELFLFENDWGTKERSQPCLSRIVLPPLLPPSHRTLTPLPLAPPHPPHPVAGRIPSSAYGSGHPDLFPSGCLAQRRSSRHLLGAATPWQWQAHKDAIHAGARSSSPKAEPPRPNHKILEAREKLSQNLQHQTKLESNEDTVALTFSNADGTVLMPVEVVSVLKDQDAPGRPTALRNVDYGILEPIHLQALSKDTVSDAGAVASDKISSSVPLVLYSLCQYQKMPLISHNQGWKKAFTLPLKNMPLNSAPSEEVQRKWPSSDLSEQSRVVIQKAHNDGCDDDGDEWLEEDTAGPGSTHIPIVGDE
ncbi:uncharacterized protein LOC123450194 [Hordeum vulgare subsp. vulgare]|uniref:uncharacterized protein LOC123450194 n=1 Tax=Hordeum vulgare subsp. vulgare TaxID=112509 RepID=UPI001D1A350F|nr:uncharacterized protein LOC123450194 [Hordeum vulgare subsp. vulgare]